jgi:hypothetical protein
MVVHSDLGRFHLVPWHRTVNGSFRIRGQMRKHNSCRMHFVILALMTVAKLMVRIFVQKETALARNSSAPRPW